MIKIEHVDVSGFEAAIRGMRNPMDSWEQGDSFYDYDWAKFVVGPKDRDLMVKLAKGGGSHAKFRRMINVTIDITAPLYWWKEFDTYKVGTVANSCSTMHRIHAKELTVGDFSHEHLVDSSYGLLLQIIDALNEFREQYLNFSEPTEQFNCNKDVWWQMIQLLPSSYNQRRTVQLNYEVLAAIYRDRHNHKLDEWVYFCSWIETLPYSEVITLKNVK